MCHRDSTAAGCSGVEWSGEAGRRVREFNFKIFDFICHVRCMYMCVSVCVLVYACTYLLTYYRLCCCNPLIIFMLGIVLCVRAKAPKVMQQLVYMTCNL